MKWYICHHVLSLQADLTCNGCESADIVISKHISSGVSSLISWSRQFRHVFIWLCRQIVMYSELYQLFFIDLVCVEFVHHVSLLDGPCVCSYIVWFCIQWTFKNALDFNPCSFRHQLYFSGMLQLHLKSTEDTCKERTVPNFETAARGFQLGIFRFIVKCIIYSCWASVNLLLYGWSVNIEKKIHMF